MLISQKTNDAINAQIGREFGAMLQYVNVAAYFSAESLPRLAAHFYRQADEEREHAMKFVHYVVDAGGRVAIPSVPATRSVGGAEEAVKVSLDWEVQVTKQIHDLLNLAVQEKDPTTQQFLQWFVEEQLEEVSSMDQLLSIVRRAGPQLLFVEDYLARESGGEEK